jgi:type III pantothenate kinase
MPGNHFLEIDVGNSSYKWRLMSEGRILSSGRFTPDELLPGFEAVIRDVSGSIAARVASVAGVQADGMLINALETLNIKPVSFAKVSREQAGVRCGYKDLSQLGVDRWLAVLAAASEFDGPLAVADFGTALTLDFVDANRNHIGGYIVPGWGLMCQALMEGTAIDVSRIPFDYDSDDLQPGVSSSSAIGKGRLLSLSALVSAGVTSFKTMVGQEVKLVCTGGDAFRILPFLDIKAEIRPDLVLDGLALAVT